MEAERSVRAASTKSSTALAFPRVGCVTPYPLAQLLQERTEACTEKLTLLAAAGSPLDELRSCALVLAEIRPELVTPRQTKRHAAAGGSTARWACLLEQDKHDVEQAFCEPDGHVVIKAFKCDFTVKSLKCLRPGEWVNDEVINFYINLIRKRHQRYRAESSVYLFNSFLYPKIEGEWWADLHRWTATVDLFAFEKVMVPIHVNKNHWVAAVIYMQRKEIVMYDSLYGKDNCISYREGLFRYLLNEHQHQKLSPMDEVGWNIYQKAENVPLQKNWIDCGLFTLMILDSIEADREFDFTQEDIPRIRQYIASCILKCALNY